MATAQLHDGLVLFAIQPSDGDNALGSPGNSGNVVVPGTQWQVRRKLNKQKHCHAGTKKTYSKTKLNRWGLS